MAISRRNPLQQRLIAAGAQPERAQGFVDRVAFDKGPQLATFGGAPKVSGGMKPIVLGDSYDDKTTQARKDYFPNLFYPPEPESQDFKSYFDVVLGKGAYNNFFNKSFATKAPTYSVGLKQSPGTFEYVVANGVKKGLSPETIINSLPDLKITGIKTPAQYSDYVYKIFNEYTDAQDKVNTDLVKRIEKDKAYKFGLPDPKLRYGLTTDLNKGTIAITFQPAVANALAKLKRGGPIPPERERALLSNALIQINKAKLTPFIDAKKLGEKFRGKRP
jgi:hypothetical protein